MKLNEYNIIQNNVIGAMAIYSFVKSYYDTKNKTEGPSIALCMPILPIVFNEDCYSEISKVSRITKSRFLTVLSDNRSIPVGLQKRMVGMADQTLKSLNMAFALHILMYNQETSQVYPVPRSKLPTVQFKDNIEILMSSKALGNWFANYSTEELCVSLNIVF